MMRRLRERLTYGNAMATLAVFIALGGSSYAAFTLPRNSVGARQIRPNAVGASEIRSGAVRSREIRDRSVQIRDIAASAITALRGAAGPTGPPGPQGVPGPTGPTYWAAVAIDGALVRGNANGESHTSLGVYEVTWRTDVSQCGAVATLASPTGAPSTLPPPGFATVAPSPNGATIRTYDRNGAPQDLPFDVVIAC